ncbi:DUF1995 family protein [Synechococcus sp. CS-1325]|uniref:DUF1995 family protein n=1 Tax=Synechococcus sp. CS-1325 TaxID=2847979 RepID=UPI000DB30B9A|nr:DUF1995 family protein [Synechococcus sp. CS-1325]MCT0199378.1 DUF1995 family protein [Synechococcus sp. CS-1325]PZV02994.1 MAG: DUF1995 domain-containing protein [Cyanobium sp.]
MLPSDLRSAEAQAVASLQAALGARPTGRWTAEFRFEGLKILPLALRLATSLKEKGLEPRLLFPDAGATALAKRDAPDLAPGIASLGDQLRLQAEPGESSAALPLLLVAPGLSDYEQVERIHKAHAGPMLMLNGNLEDAAVGIGSVARQRRKGFLATWSCAYALIPLAEAALLRCFPEPWTLYRRDADGYRPVASFEQKPDAEQQALALNPDQAPSVADGLQALDRFLDSLSN